MYLLHDLGMLFNLSVPWFANPKMGIFSVDSKVTFWKRCFKTYLYQGSEMLSKTHKG